MKTSNLQSLMALLIVVGAMSDNAFALEPLALEVAKEPVGENSDLTYSPNWPEPPNTSAMLWRMAGGTAVVLVLCIGTLVLGKPWLQKLQTGSTPESLMQVQGSVALGSRAMLHLIKVGDTQLVAGTDATGLKSLVVIPASFKDVLDAQLPTPEMVLAVNESLGDQVPGPAGPRE